MAERITLQMSPFEIAMAMSGGNPRSAQICRELLLNGDLIDPDLYDHLGYPHMGGAYGVLLALDILEIYDERIGMLWAVCQRDLGKMMAVVFACRLKLAGVDRNTLNHAIDNQGAGLDLDTVVAAVKNHLPKFNPEAAPNASIG